MKFWTLVVATVAITFLSACGDNPQGGSGSSGGSSTLPDDFSAECMEGDDEDIALSHRFAVHGVNEHRQENIRAVYCLDDYGFGRHHEDIYCANTHEPQETLHHACWEHVEEMEVGDAEDYIHDEPCLWTAYGYMDGDYCQHDPICVTESDWETFFLDSEHSSVEAEWGDELVRICDI